MQLFAKHSVVPCARPFSPIERVVSPAAVLSAYIFAGTADPLTLPFGLASVPQT